MSQARRVTDDRVRLDVRAPLEHILCDEAVRRRVKTVEAKILLCVVERTLSNVVVDAGHMLRTGCGRVDGESAVVGKQIDDG